MVPTTRRFCDIATTLADLNAAGLSAQAVNDSLTMWLSASGLSFSNVMLLHPCFTCHSNSLDQVLLLLSNVTLLPHGVPGIGAPDADIILASTPQLRVLLQTTPSRQMNFSTLLYKPLGPAIRTKPNQKALVNSIQLHLHKQLVEQHSATSDKKAVLISQSGEHTGARLQQATSEACEREDRLFRVSVATTLMLPHPASPLPAGIASACANKSSTGLVRHQPVDTHQLHC